MKGKKLWGAVSRILLYALLALLIGYTVYVFKQI